jgi:uncharacterized protein YkwD
MEESELLELHNAYRAKFQLEDLELDEVLCEHAQAHSNYMERRNKLNHDGFHDRMKSLNTAIAENVGYSPSAIACFNMWVGSKGHDANIRGKYTKVGFGRKGNYWTTIFS